jgi:hypothetical protein
MSHHFEMRKKQIGDWKLPVLVLSGHSQRLALPVSGLIGNSIPSSSKGKQRTTEWKLKVGNAVKSVRGPNPWDSNGLYAITVGFSFHLPSHGNRSLDVENYIKPTLDALAAGLFCLRKDDLKSVKRWDFDDSNFRNLFIHRLRDATTQDEEGIALFVSTATHNT